MLLKLVGNEVNGILPRMRHSESPEEYICARSRVNTTINYTLRSTCFCEANDEHILCRRCVSWATDQFSTIFRGSCKSDLAVQQPTKMENYAQTKTLPDDSLPSVTAVSIWLFTSHGTPGQ